MTHEQEIELCERAIEAMNAWENRKTYIFGLTPDEQEKHSRAFKAFRDSELNSPIRVKELLLELEAKDKRVKELEQIFEEVLEFTNFKNADEVREFIRLQKESK